MRRDLQRRRPFYWSDWKDGYHRKVLSATFFMFFTSIAPAITFAAVLDSDTRVNDQPQLGPVEVLLSTSITGTIFAIFSGQPLCIVGVTGPVTIFTISVFNLAEGFNIDFLPFYCWTQLWAALFHIILASINAYACHTHVRSIAACCRTSVAAAQAALAGPSWSLRAQTRHKELHVSWRGISSLLRRSGAKRADSLIMASSSL
eukprot:6180793-Pleurochrysis_carterae.AAC.1